MSIEFNGDSVILTGTLEKLSTFASKGGGVNLTVQASDDPKTSSSLIANRGKIARITFEFSSVRASNGKNVESDGEFEFHEDTAELPNTPEPGKKKGKKIGTEGDQERLD